MSSQRRINERCLLHREITVRVGRAERRGKRTKSSKKPSSTTRKTVKRRVTFQSSAWYQKAALAISAVRNRD
jgi:hypothetical protein